MEKQTKYPNIEKFKAKLATEHENFERQLKEVKKKYPLVALAYALQKATLAELSLPKAIGAEAIHAVSRALTPELSKAATDIEVEQNERIRKRNICLGRARSYAEGAACF